MLFATTFNNTMLLQYRPGGTTPDRMIDLGTAGIGSSTGTPQFVPTGFGGAGFKAAIDPVTGDFLFSTFGGGDRILVISGFVAPPPVIPSPDRGR